jgi:hypothetical protein
MGDDTLCSLRSIWRERASRWSAVRIGIAAPPPSVRPSDHRRFELGNGTARRVRLDLLRPSLFFFSSAVTSRPHTSCRWTEIPAVPAWHELGCQRGLSCRAGKVAWTRGKKMDTRRS